MQIVYNAEHKRVCDISPDGRTIVIKVHGYVTLIRANPDGTLRVENMTEER